MFMRNALLFTVSCLLAATAFAQRNPRPALSVSGVYEYTSFAVGHDSSAGWSSEMDSALGYMFSPKFSVEAGAPFYLVTTTQATSGATTQAGSLGDAFLRASLRLQPAALSYATGVTVTAPTGDTNSGVSTGRATVTWNNRLEHGSNHFTPFGEASLGNSLNSSRRYLRDYTTLGAVSEFRGGVGLDLSKHVSLETSLFGDVGYGDQKIFSRTVRKDAIAATTVAKHNRSFETAYVTSGAAGLVNDNGFTADLSWSPARRMDVNFAYNHSLHFATDSVSAGIGVRLGRMASDGTKR